MSPSPVSGMTWAAPLQEQEALDSFYWDHRPCCAGCDHWRSVNAVVGECTRAAPMSGEQRAALLDMSSISLPVGAGHPMTMRQYVCGEFKDEFDWSSLPLAYRKRVGAPTRGEAS